MQASLPSISSQEENEFIKSIANGARVWIGGVRDCLDCDDFQWYDGSDWNFTNWAPNNPGLRWRVTGRDDRMKS